MGHVRGCARCGADHNEIQWEHLERPIRDTDGTEWTEWAPCPQNGQPILSRMSAGKQTSENSIEVP